MYLTVLQFDLRRAKNIHLYLVIYVTMYLGANYKYTCHLHWAPKAILVSPHRTQNSDHIIQSKMCSPPPFALGVT